MSGTSISVTPQTLGRFNDLKAELNEAQADLPDHNADSFLNALLDTWEQVDGQSAPREDTARKIVADLRDTFGIEGDADVSELIHAEADPQEIKAQLDRIEAAATTAEDRTGQIQRDVEALGGGR